MRSRRRTIPGDILLLSGCLVTAFVAIGAFVAYSNDCVAADSAEHRYTLLPGLDLEALPVSTREALTTRLNQRHCTCGCLMSIASCLNNHTACHTSKRLSLEMAESVHAEFRPAHGHP